ncbi:hypothetical protein [Anaerococcus sp.]|uniref:hypothetical protein n=1 Tax=Anaerococcus sp. TaxID=1872515 RepID=UPI002A747CC7|nr:hypothetical protein [Anaerococcus sp.]MDY2927610.1 hypothetical protein [Anaerococcus sp.]
MATIAMLILFLVLGGGMIKFIFKLGLGIIGLVLGLVFFPVLLVITLLALPLAVIGGFLGLIVKLLPVLVVAGLGYFGYRYYKENYQTW